MPEQEISDFLTRAENWFATADWTSILAATAIIVVTVWLRRPFSRLCINILDALLRHLSVGLNDKVKDELTVTTSVLLVALAILAALEVLGPPLSSSQIAHRLLASVAIIAIFSGWYNLSDAFVSLMQSDRFQNVQVEANWVERIAQFAILLFGITALLKVWKVDISGALTGVGVLGAGMAIATQDMIRNLIAVMNNISEKRFTVGDAVQIDGVLVGTVEQIDLRSTLIRGFDQIPRYVPNSELSNSVVSNYAQRRNRRVQLSIPLLLSSTPEQIHDVCDGLRTHLSDSGDFDLSDAAPKHVTVEGLSTSAVLVMFYAWTRNPDYQNFLEVNERLTLEIMKQVQQAGTSLAYPTQTVDMQSHGDETPD